MPVLYSVKCNKCGENIKAVRPDEMGEAAATHVARCQFTPRASVESALAALDRIGRGAYSVRLPR